LLRLPLKFGFIQIVFKFKKVIASQAKLCLTDISQNYYREQDGHRDEERDSFFLSVVQWDKVAPMNIFFPVNKQESINHKTYFCVLSVSNHFYDR